MSGLLSGYAFGRVAFGVAAMVAPAAVGRMLLGEEGDRPVTRALMGNFGTRDVLLGAGLMHAVRSGAPARPWLVAGIGADVLDTVVQLRAWNDLQPDRRVPGVAFALVAAAAGGALFAAGGG
jgi:hypothetical protein